MRYALITVALVVVWVPAGLDAQQPAETAAFTKLPVVQVVIEDLHPGAERDGLTTSQLQTDVEVRLREAGIRVTNNAVDYVGVSISAMQSTDVTDLYAYSLHVSLHRRIVVEANGMDMLAEVWSSGRVGTVGSTRWRDVRNMVRDQIDAFINAYLSVNPKR